MLDFDPSFVLVGLHDRLFSCMHTICTCFCCHACIHVYIHTDTHACMHYIIVMYTFYFVPYLYCYCYSIIEGINARSRSTGWDRSIYASCNDLHARRTTSEMDSRILYIEHACHDAADASRSIIDPMHSVHVTICRPS